MQYTLCMGTFCTIAVTLSLTRYKVNFLPCRVYGPKGPVVGKKKAKKLAPSSSVNSVLDLQCLHVLSKRAMPASGNPNHNADITTQQLTRLEIYLHCARASVSSSKNCYAFACTHAFGASAHCRCHAAYLMPCMAYHATSTLPA